MVNPATPLPPHRAPPAAVWQAPAAWQTVEFISDLHLASAEEATFAAWQRYLQQSTADAVVILGDLFEVWVGDDAALGTSGDLEPLTFEARCIQVLQAATQLRPVFFMHGNRDFLVGRRFEALTGVRLLADPTVLLIGTHRVLLSHGDALCLDDLPYQAFRAEVRTDSWISSFLAKPLHERVAAARAMRAQSEASKRMQAPAGLVDLDGTASRAWLAQGNAGTLVHGHTHRPVEHDLGHGLQRIVLSDWDLSAQPPRAQVLRLQCPGNTGQPLQFTRLSWA